MDELFVNINISHLVANSRIIYIRDVKSLEVKVGYTRVDSDRFIKFSNNSTQTLSINDVVSEIIELSQSEEDFVLEAPFTTVVVMKRKEEGKQ